MKFEHEGNMYSLDFQRERKPVVVGATPEGEPVQAPSLYPYTTVVLWRKMKDGTLELFRTATVGCWHGEYFTLEKGRLQALRLVSKTLSKELKKKMWAAYMNRV